MDITGFSDTSDLSEEKRKLLAYLLEEEGVELLEPAAIVPRAGAGDLPLSFAQERLWLLDQLAPDSLAYTVLAVLRLDGRLDAVALARSLNTIVRRHEALRTTFAIADGRPVQVINPAAPLALPLLDLRELPEPSRGVTLRRLALAQAGRPFDLARGPLLRATLLRFDAAEHALVLTLHHIVCDGWSVGVFMRELAALYAAFAAGQPAPLPELPIQYADYALWQREWLRGAALESQLAYWKRQLAGPPPLLELPTDHPRPRLPSYRGDSHRFVLPPPLIAALTALGLHEGVTLFMALLAAFDVLLAHYTGQEDLLVGTPIANRTRAEVEGLIGCFVNTLVLRADLSGNPGFRALLGRVSATCLGAYAHQDLPFARLVEELQAARDLGRNPLFQVMFVLQNAPPPPLELAGLTLRPLPIDNETSAFELSLTLEERAEGLDAWIEYSTDLFEAATIARMAGHFGSLLEGIVADPARRLWDLPLLTEAERNQLLVEWNAPAFSLQPSAFSLQELFAEQAARAPDAIALQTMNDEDRTMNGPDSAFIVHRSSFSAHLTYAELNARANRLAHHLRDLGVGPEVRVAICVERSLELLVGLLGILKAGGAYVPLDPSYPAERLAFMLEDSGARVLITTNDHRPTTNEARSLVGGRSSLVEVDLARDWPAIARQPATNPASGASPENLAYVIYTSGSTGTPKGVMIAHRSLMAYTRAACASYAITPADRCLQFASISFDTSVEEIYPCLVRGATLVLRSDAMLVSAAQFLEVCRAWAISVLNLPTAYWHELAARLAAEALTLPAPMRLVVIGGEQALADRLAAWRARVDPRVRLVNVYGPTEVTVGATMGELAGPAVVAPREVPLGRPIPSARIYLLNRYAQPVPIGVAGEICVAGAGLARGYLGRPDLTAERFIPDPSTTTNDRRPTTDDELAAIDGGQWSLVGGRLYRTGDLARYRPDGALEFLSRIDQQVKLRGFRVEVGEIETVLARHPAVDEAAVAVREDTPGHKRLVAYVVTSNELQVTSVADSSLVTHNSSLAAELRTFLAERLPEYMVPSAFVLLDALPRTPNGKLDRKALPAPASLQPDLAAAYIAPRTEVERAIARVWQEALGIEKVGLHDNFFDLGGHSLLLVQVHGRLSEALKHDLSMLDMFRYPTVSTLAAHLREQSARSAQQQSEHFEKMKAGKDRLSQRLKKKQKRS